MHHQLLQSLKELQLRPLLAPLMLDQAQLVDSLALQQLSLQVHNLKSEELVPALVLALLLVKNRVLLESLPVEQLLVLERAQLRSQEPNLQVELLKLEELVPQLAQ